MAKRNATICDKMSVIIPYRQLEEMLNTIQQVEEMEKRYRRIEERMAAMQNMYCEVLEKIAEIDRYL